MFLKVILRRINDVRMCCTADARTASMVFVARWRNQLHLSEAICLITFPSSHQINSWPFIFQLRLAGGKKCVLVLLFPGTLPVAEGLLSVIRQYVKEPQS